ncbi:MAG: hypothetical protein ACI81L_002750 [Verrucomicrobiales bacterium]|jgi:hypothetical protein
MDVASDREKVRICLHQDRVIARLEEWPVAPMAFVEFSNVHRHDSVKRYVEVWVRAANEKMEMVAHQAIGMDLDLMNSGRCRKEFKKAMSIDIIEEDVLATSANVHDVVPPTRA